MSPTRIKTQVVLNVEYEILIIGLVGAVVSPLVTALGLYLQHQRDRRKVVAESKKEEAEAEKIEQEAKTLELKNNIDTVNYYIGVVTALRSEVNALTELSRKNGGEIAVLTARLKVADDEKERLAKENTELVKKVQDLSQEVEMLKANQKV